MPKENDIRLYKHFIAAGMIESAEDMAAKRPWVLEVEEPEVEELVIEQPKEKKKHGKK